MKGKELLGKVGTSLTKVGFKAKKFSPELLAAAGVVGIVVGVVTACKATIKATEVLEEHKANIDAIHEAKKTAESGESKLAYSQEDEKRDLTIAYSKTAIKLVKTFAVPVLICTVSVAALLGSNQILHKRNAALAAAYATIDKSYKDYRDRVIERFGEQTDREMKYGIKAVELKEQVTDENGKKKTIKKTIDTVDSDAALGDYARFFDSNSPYWETDPEYNLMFLKAQQNYANDKLRANGYLFLNDVLKALGLPECKEGQIMGWIWDKNRTDAENEVDFGIFNIYRESNRDFVNGYENTALLDFNVHDNVYENM